MRTSSEHVALEVGHTKFNAREMDRLLQAHPDFLDPLSAAAIAALESYGEFLADCLRYARGGGKEPA